MEKTVGKEPSVCFKVERIIGVSVGTGNVRTYQVQWAPVWVSGLHLVGCEHLIEEFLLGQTASNGYDVNFRSKTSSNDSSSDSVDVRFKPHTTTHTSEESCTSVDGNSLLGGTRDDMLQSSNISQSSTVFSSDAQYSTVGDEDEPVIVIPVEVTVGECTDSCEYGVVDPSVQSTRMDEEVGNSGDDSCHTLFSYVSNIANESSTSSMSTSEATEQVCSTNQNKFRTKTNNINNIGNKLSIQKQQSLFENSGYDCHECHKKFTYKSSLRKHIQLHKNQDPHSCGICNQTFNSKTDLKIHSTLHTGETPLQCSYCSKVFSQKHYLMVHERQHLGDNPHKCSECDKVFTSRANLEKHFRLHTGEKPYECPACSKRFTQKGNLRSHFVRIHKMLELKEYNLEEL